VILSEVVALTDEVDTVNVADVCPAGIVTVEGTGPLVELAVRFTIAPPVGAIPLRVTVPVALAPPLTDAGLKATPTNKAGVIVKLADFEPEPDVAVIATVALVPTPVVVIGKLALVLPARITTEVGTVAAELLLFKEMTIPSDGAAKLRVTVPKEPFPPRTDDGLRVNPVTDGGLTVKLALCVAPFAVAEIVATC